MKTTGMRTAVAALAAGAVVGVVNVDWWALHQGGFGAFNGGDLGLLSTGSDDCIPNGACAPPAQTPYRPYRAMQMVGALTRDGGAMVPVTSSDPQVVGHAVRRPDGTLQLLVQNGSPTTAVSARFAGPGYHTVAAIQYADTDTRPHAVTPDGNLPAYSLTVLTLHH